MISLDFMKQRITGLMIVILCFISIYGLGSEEFSLRKKKSFKKADPPKKVTETGLGFSRENNRISNQYWIEESALFIFDPLEPSLPQGSNISENEEKQPIAETPPPQKEETILQNNSDKNKQNLSSQNKQNIVLQFLSDNKKILLILGLIIIFAVYRLRGNSPTSTPSTRTISKFRNK